MQRQAVGGQDRAQIGERVHRMHAGQRPRRRGVDRADQPVGGRTAQKRRLDKARPMQVIDKTAGAPNKRPILDTRIAASDVWRSTIPNALFATLSAAMAGVCWTVQRGRMTAHSIVTPLALIVAAQLSTSAAMKVFR